MPLAKSPTTILRALALRHADVVEAVACKGTPVESSAFRVGKKTFLFARDVEMMVKLAKSLPEAKEQAAQDPVRYRAGSGGWVTVKFVDGVTPPRDLLTRWIAESYGLMAASPAVKESGSKKGKRTAL